MQDRLYYLGFSLFPGVGPALFARLFAHFGSAQKAWHAQEHALKEVVGEKLTAKFLAFQKTIDLEREYEKLIQKQVSLVLLEDKAYPPLLKQIENPPFVLYVKGDMAALSQEEAIGIVGTRKITTYGRDVTEMITRELVGQGFVIVSGLAFGVDALSHVTTMRNQGKTIAVLGCGVDCCTPFSNQKIYDEIVAGGGAVVSTVPLGMQANRGSFPMRNRIIAGLSRGVVVTEGALDSGSLITASYAKKMGRPVFAVPGPITSSLSEGSNALIKNGAIAITAISDILDNLGILKQINGMLKPVQHDSRKKGESKEEQEILDILQNGPLLFDEIVRTIKRDSNNIGSLLSLMELKGVIRSGQDGRYYI